MSESAPRCLHLVQDIAPRAVPCSPSDEQPWRLLHRRPGAGWIPPRTEALYGFVTRQPGPATSRRTPGVSPPRRHPRQEGARCHRLPRSREGDVPAVARTGRSQARPQRELEPRERTVGARAHRHSAPLLRRSRAGLIAHLARVNTTPSSARLPFIDARARVRKQRTVPILEWVGHGALDAADPRFPGMESAIGVLDAAFARVWRCVARPARGPKISHFVRRGEPIR